MPRTVDAIELIQRAIESRVSDVWTSIPGTIKAYTPGPSPVADILPCVRAPVPNEDGDTVYEDLPVIPNVPIAFPRGKKGAYSITWPLEPGDSVLLVVNTVAIGEWRSSGQVSSPGDLRLHSLGSVIAYPGIGPDAEPLGGSGSAPASLPALVLEGPEVRIGKDATLHPAYGEAVWAWLQALKDGVTGAGGVVVPPPDYATSDKVIASKVKVK